MSKKDGRVSVTVRMTLKSRQLLAIFAKNGSGNKSAELEDAIRCYAENKGIDYTQDLSEQSGIKH